MNYFNNVETLEELRKQYKELLKRYHPDNPQGRSHTSHKYRIQRTIQGIEK